MVSIKWEKPKYDDLDNKEKYIIKRARELAKSFKIYAIKSDVFRDITFLRYRISVDFEQELKKKKEKLLERIVKVSNIAQSNSLAEVVDIHPFVNSLGQIDKEVVMEFFRGFILEDAIKDLVIYSKQQQKDTDTIASRRIMRNIVPSIINFQEDLYEKGIVHVGLFPEHIIILKDDILKFKGLRYIVRHKSGVIDDKAILNEELYGNIIDERYTPDELKEYINSGGETRIMAKPLISYQLGVLLFDIFTKREYAQQPFRPELVQNAIYHIPGGDVELAKNFINKLVARDPNLRETNLDRIRKMAHDFANSGSKNN